MQTPKEATVSMGLWIAVLIVALIVATAELIQRDPVTVERLKDSADYVRSPDTKKIQSAAEWYDAQIGGN